MELPSKCGVMFLSGVTLFPGEKLPLRIFEPRYREMLDQALVGSRMFAVATEYRETDQPVVGLGLIKSSQEQPDGTSLLLLEGVGRVRLLKEIEAGSYPHYAIEPVHTIFDLLETDEMTRELLLNLCIPYTPEEKTPILEFLREIETLDMLADQISAFYVESGEERINLLQCASLQERVDRLIRLLSI